jgi:uncharacterized protein
MNASEWANSNLIFKTIAGSNLYGTNRPDSDIDYRGVCLDPPQSIIGLQGFEQYQKLDEDNDIVIYGASKFLKMCLDANPSILDILFAPPHKWVKHTDEWMLIYDARHSFLSQKVRYTFSGYAFSQLKRIERHKKWIDNPPAAVYPKDYGLYLHSTPRGGQRYEPIPVRYNFVLGRWPFLDLNNIKSATRRRSVYRPQDRTAMISAFKHAQSEYGKYREWLNNRNEYRAELESMYGYDVKHASHLARLLMKGLEILTTGTYNPVLDDGQLAQFNKIMDGLVEYYDLVGWAYRADNIIRSIDTDLQNRPDFRRYRDLYLKLACASLRRDSGIMELLKGE